MVIRKFPSMTVVAFNISSLVEDDWTALSICITFPRLLMSASHHSTYGHLEKKSKIKAVPQMTRTRFKIVLP